MKLKLRGILPAILTPFTKEEEVDESGLRDNIRFFLKSGVHGIVANASTSEAVSLSDEERKRIAEIVVDEVGGKIPVVVGTGDPSTRRTIKLTRDAKDAGADAAMILTPFYMVPSPEGIYQHYKAINEAVDIPIVLYTCPPGSFNLSPPLVDRLTDLDNVVALKDSSANMQQVAETIRLVGNKISVLMGVDNLIFPALVMGAAGTIAALANIAPRELVTMFESVQKGDLNKAREIYYRLMPLSWRIIPLSETNFPSDLKAAMSLLGRAAGPARRPQLPITEKEKAEIKELLAKCGLL